MKNKINETKNIHTVYSVICGHDKSAPTVGVRGYTLGVRNNRSAHSVGVGADSLRPSAPNYVIAPTCLKQY
ncbi:hypothetical protein [Prevotella pallens]|uniref:hypothetical protein n=1 Tax=Prevotella pallens TaxID=60133 RepID=UPI0023EFC8DA|nr:hypothetical protein [Prevotella pallens]